MWTGVPTLLLILAGLAGIALLVLAHWRNRQTRCEHNRRVAEHLEREARHFRTLAACVHRHVQDPRATRALLQLAADTLKRLQRLAPEATDLATALAEVAEMDAALERNESAPCVAADAAGSPSGCANRKAALARERLLLNDALRLMHRARHRGLISGADQAAVDALLRQARAGLEVDSALTRAEVALQGGKGGQARSLLQQARRHLQEDSGPDRRARSLQIERRLAATGSGRLTGT